MNDLRRGNPTLYNKLVMLLARNPNDYRSFMIYLPEAVYGRDAMEFLQSWATTRTDTVEKLVEIARLVQRMDIIEELRQRYEFQ